jgi:O-antigen/teichoic acid export membrane protein
VSRDAAFLFAARVVSAGTTLILLSLLGHLRGGEELGLVATGLAVGALLAAITDAGTASLLVREGARDARQIGHILGALVLWRIAVLAVATAALWIGLILLVPPFRAPVVLFVALGLAVQQFAELTRAVFIALQKMGVSSLHSAVENLTWLTVTGVLIAVGVDLRVVFLAAAGVMVASTVLGFALIAALTEVRVTTAGPREWVRLAIKAGPFAAFVIIGVAYSRVDILLVGALVPANSLITVGAYFAAARLLTALEYLPDAVGRALFPQLARAYQEGADAVRAVLQPAVAFLLLVALPIPVAIAFAGPQLMTFLFGQDVATLNWIIVPLAVVLPLRFLGYLFGLTLTSSDAQGRRALAAASALVVVVVIDGVLLPAMGVPGAVVGFISASTLVFLLYAGSVIRAVGWLELPRVAVVAGIATAVGALAGIATREMLGGVGAAVVACAAYIVVLVVSGAWRDALATAALAS